MAGISILLMNLLLIVIFTSSFISLVFFIISMILFITNKKKKNKNIKAIITLAISIMCLMPLIITIILSIASFNANEIDNIKKLNALENKIIVNREKWIEGFEYKGDYLIPVNIFINSDNYKLNNNLNKVGTLVFNNSTTYHSLYEITNDSGYKIYYIWVVSSRGNKYYSRTFVSEHDYNNILNYYSTANYKVKCLWKSSPNINLRNTWKSLDLNINNNIDDLMNLSHDVLDDIQNKNQTTFSDTYDDCMHLEIKSEDGVYTMDFSIYMKNDKMIVYLNNYRLDDDIVNKYNNLLNYIVQEVKKQLNEYKEVV